MAHCWIVLGCGTILTINMATRTSAEQQGSPRPRPRSMTEEVEEAMSPRERERVTKTAEAVHREVEQSIAPFAMGLLRLRNAIVMSERASSPQSQAESRQLRARTVTKTVTTDAGERTFQTRELEGTPEAELLTFFVGDNTGSMSTSEGAFAQREREHIAMMGEGFMQLSDGSICPFKGQSILFGFPDHLRVNGRSIVDPRGTSDADKTSITSQGVVAKKITPLGAYRDVDLTSTLEMQMNPEFRNGPTLLGPALDLVIHSLQSDQYTYDLVRSGKKAAVVFVTGDFAIHDPEDARRRIQTLREMGVRVIGLAVTASSSDQLDSSTQRMVDYLFNQFGDGKTRGGVANTQEQLLGLLTAQADYEDSVSGMSSAVQPVVRRRVAPPTRTTTRTATRADGGQPTSVRARTRTATRTEEE